jgi:hypothetical protein
MPLRIDLGEVIRRALESRAQDIWTAFPAKIVAYDSETQTADVEPQVRRIVPDEDSADVETEDLPIVVNVPIQFPRGGEDSIAITWPLQAGDYVWVHVCTNAIGNWRRTGELSDPGDVRTHGLGSCFAVPGAAPNSRVLPQATINALILEAPEIRAGKDASDYAALASKCNSNFDAIKTMFNTWVVVPQDGGAALKTQSSSLSFEDVACSKVKVQ